MAAVVGDADMNTLRGHYDEFGNVVAVELMSDPDPVAQFTDEFVSRMQFQGVVERGDGLIKLKCVNGEWVYRITDYDVYTKVLTGELVSPDGA